MADVLIKACGLRTPDDIDAAVAAGVTHVGLVHYAPSARHVELDQAAALRARLPASVKAVLLLVNHDPAETAAAIARVNPDIVQFHGNETPQWLAILRQVVPQQLWKAYGVKNARILAEASDYAGAAHRILYDAPAGALPGGNGLAIDWSLFAGHRHALPWGLAGGLSPDNVAEAIRRTGAPLVDASSGLESAPGVKDPARIAAFAEAARSA
ncbi:phosphoribosylanthranilate isomerase [Parablastomonas sp. CN1-191]|uniref:phosphoribosylanthranilate isomerase n=1 Tax=Parablastomonas sp. CN1-191 TaxID=3400908 RepID=UPI003BF8BC9E